jgi:hypothetical protein
MQDGMTLEQSIIHMGINRSKEKLGFPLPAMGCQVGFKTAEIKICVALIYNVNALDTAEIVCMAGKPHLRHECCCAPALSTTSAKPAFTCSCWAYRTTNLCW